MSNDVDRALAYRIFDDALDIEPGARAKFLLDRCGEDTALAREVASLLAVAAHDARSTSSLLESGKPDGARDFTGREYGQFRLTALIGEGGMGVVYRAERIGGVPQTVAVKLIRCEINEASAARFVREARLLARLEHPAIARLIDVGIKDGEPWLAIEYVPGVPIDEYCDQHHLDLRSRVKLLALLVDAAATAHRMLVVHRDIKPTNVLVSEDGRPKLIDFGIAAALSSTTDVREATADIRQLFSPHYAAPEQVTGDPVTVATDVFGLGALAYRLLTGRAPFAGSTSAIGYLLAVTQQDIDPPSRTAQQAGTDQADARRLRGDLDAIVLKALQRRPSRRYATAQDLRADLLRYLDGIPVSARKQTLRYRAARFAARHAMAVSIGAALFLALAAGAVIYGVQARTVVQARNMAVRRDEFLESLLKSADPRSGQREVTVAQLLDSATQELDHKLSGEPLVEASMLSLIAQTNTGLGRYAEGLAANDRELKILREHGGTVLEIGQALSIRGELLREEGKWAEAEPVVRDAVRVLSGFKAPRDLCGALYLLAVVLAHTGHEEEALATYRQLIGIEEHGDAELKRRLAYPYHGIAVTSADLARYTEAAESARKAVELAQATMAPDNPELLAFQTTYAGALVNTHRAAEAEPLFRRIIDAETRVLGAGHKDTLLAQLVFVDDLMELHRDVEAEALSLPTARALEALLGPDNFYTLAAWNEHASAACNTHHEEEGLELLRKVEVSRHRVFPPGDRYIHATEVSIGVCLLRMKRYAEAEAELATATQGLEAARGPNYRKTQEAYAAMSELYAATNRPQLARVWAAKINTDAAAPSVVAR